MTFSPRSIAGPRRAKPAPPALPVSPRATTPVPSAPVAAPAATLADPSRGEDTAKRTLPTRLHSLDFEDSGARTRVFSPSKSLVDLTVTGTAKALRFRKGRWFAFGLLVGAILVCSVRGDVRTGIRHARSWSASAIRSFKRATPDAPALALPAAPASTSAPEATCNEQTPPEKMDAACRELLAPFHAPSAEPEPSTALPTVDVTALPKAKPRYIWVPPPPAPAATADEATKPGDAKPATSAKEAPVEIPAPIPRDDGIPLASAGGRY